MLRGIHKATSTWVGKAVMAVIMGFLDDQLRDLGHRRHFPRLRPEFGRQDRRHRNLDRTVPAVLHRQAAAAQPAAAPADFARSGARARLDRQLLGQLVAETTLDEQAKQLRLGLSDKDIAERITTDPNFRGPDGKFEPRRASTKIIRQAGFNEARYVAEQRNVMLRRQIAQTVSGELKVPADDAGGDQPISERKTRHRICRADRAAGRRHAGADAGRARRNISTTRKVLFRAPEYRKVTLLSLTPAELAKPDAVSDADAKAYYEARKDNYGTPEKRELRQIVFPKPEDAAAAHEKIVKGMSFADLAKERGMKPIRHRCRHRDQGRHHRSGGRQSRLRAQIRRSQRAGQGHLRHRAVAGRQDRARHAKDLRRRRGRDQTRTGRKHAPRPTINNLRDKIEDERAAGSTLAETAKKLNLKAVTIDAVDRSGRAPDGKPVAALPKTPDVVAAAFASDVGVDNEALQLPDDGYLYYDVTGITPSRERTLDEVKDQVAARWRDDEIAKRLQGQGRRDGRRAQEPARRSRRSRPTTASRSKPPSTCNAASRPASCRPRSSTRCSRPPRARRPRRRRQADRALSSSS